MASSTHQEQKLALIIGINKYPYPYKLNYCINDARNIGTKLESIGFRVTLGIDCDKNEFNRLIIGFVEKITPRDLILFYFAGHGNQFEDKNYLLPAGYSYDHSTNERKYIEDNSINAQYILHKIETQNVHATVFILDCCRFYVKNRAINSQQGLAPIKGPPESLIAFSCGFNQGGIDETLNDQNGIFTEHLLKYIGTPDQDIETVLQMVARDIKLKGFPLPWRSSCLTQKIYLVTANSEGNNIFLKNSLPYIVVRISPCLREKNLVASTCKTVKVS
jgi:hypothetical protein